MDRMVNIAPPYYAVIFTNQRTAGDPEGYEATAERMVELARTMPGFLGIDSARNPDGFGITVSYWQDDASIRHWQQHAEHLQAQALGKSRWYESYQLHVGKVERERHFARDGRA